MNKKKIIHIAFILIIAFTALKVNGMLLGNTTELSYKGILCYMIPSVIAMGLYLYYKKAHDLFFENSSRRRRYPLGSCYLIVAGMIFCILNILSLETNALQNFNGKVAGYLLGMCFLTGLFEEMIFRGLVQTMVYQIFGNKKQYALLSVSITSILFAISHLFNLIENPNFILGTMTQVIYTFCLGMLLGVTYFISKSLILVIGLHGIFNFLGQFTMVYLPLEQTTGTDDITIASMSIQLVVMLPCVMIAKKMMRSHIGNMDEI